MKPTPLSAAKTALAILKQNCPENLCLYAGYYDAIRALEETIKVEEESLWKHLPNLPRLPEREDETIKAEEESFWKHLPKPVIDPDPRRE